MTKFNTDRLKEEIDKSEYLKAFLIRFSVEYAFNGNTASFKGMLEDIAIAVDVV